VLAHLQGVVLTKKKKVYTRLSLSLLPGRESKRRGQGELDPDQVQPLDCHFQPTCSVPDQLAYGLLFLFRGWYPLNRYLFQMLLWLYMIAVHDLQNISKSVPGGRPSGTAPVAETGAVPAP